MRNLAALAALAACMLCACQLEMDDIIPCGLEILGSCPHGQACVESECRTICHTNADCGTCCLTAGDAADDTPDTCAPAKYCGTP
jgi:hypothetical protein